MTEFSVDRIADAVGRYLTEHPEQAAAVGEPGPLARGVQARSATWRPWLRDGGDPARARSYSGPLPADRARVAVGLLDDELDAVDPQQDQRDRIVTRPRLAQFSHA